MQFLFFQAFNYHNCTCRQDSDYKFAGAKKSDQCLIILELKGLEATVF
jgi:hypothetical protein